MTHRLYYSDAYRIEFTATVVDRDPSGTRVYLDASAFYPTSGGQPHDLGTIGGVPVVDVIDEDDRVAHVLASSLDARAMDAPVTGRIDWARRYDHMQQHTGQHLLSAVFEDLFGARTVSVHFGADYSTLDLDTEMITRDQLTKVEARANELVADAHTVMVTFEDAATATGLRKPSDRPGLLRVVTIDALDRSACGGTHVRTTAEIGAVLLRSVEKVRKTTRVEFVCGQRAIRRARRDYEALGRIAASLSSSIDEAASLVPAQSDRVKELDGTRRKLEKELATYRMRERYEAATPDPAGVRRIVVRDATSIDELRTLAQSALDLPKVVLIGALSSPPSVLVAASEDSGLQAGSLLKDRLAAVGGKGGGSPRMAQGSVPLGQLETVVKELIEG
ncbi:MAG TPA: DHHA1 domain-containing protein [Gemmatimonadaceae bacterium]|nr:DHHA1 domain-containing protein [Gemmatimonadaceae bacterium]